MARMSVPLKSYAIGVLVGIFAAAFFIVLPALIERYYPAAAPVAAVITWVGDKGALGFTAIMFTMAICMFSSLMHAAYGLISRVFNRRTTGPIALEEGVAVPAPAAPVTDAVTEEATTAPAPAKSQPGVLSKLFSLFSAIYFMWSQIHTKDIISLQRPFLDNVSAALVHLLHGFEVLFAFFLVLVLVAAVKIQWRSPTPAAVAAPGPAPPVEVLVSTDVTVVEDEKKELKELLKEEAKTEVVV